MKKILILILTLVAITGTAQAVAIDDSITPQNCDRSDARCASFLDTSSNGQIKWGGLVAGGLRSLTNFFVDGRMGLGTLRPDTGEQVLRLDVNGAVGANFYCDENGNHCVAGDSLGTGGPSTGVLIIQGTGINVTRNATTSAYIISIDPTTAQRRINGYCEVGQAIKKVNQDGTVDCQAITGGTDSFWSGNGLNITNTNSGNVGIGTNNPTGRLQLNGGNTVSRFNQWTNDTFLTMNDSVGIALLGSTAGIPFVGSQSNTDFTIRAANSEKVRVTTAGNVGIGTLTPTAKLDVAGTARIRGKIDFDGQMFILGQDSIWRSSWIGIATNVSPDGKRWLHIGGEQDSVWNGISTDGDRRIAFYADRNYFTGSVGIGTLTPTAKLDVAGTAKITGLQIPTGAGLNKVLTSDATGNATWQPSVTAPHLASGNCKPGANRSCVINLATFGFVSNKPINVVVGITAGDGSDHFHGSVSYTVSGTTLTVNIKTEDIATNWLAMQL